MLPSRPLRHMTQVPGIQNPVRLHHFARETGTPIDTLRTWVKIRRIRKYKVGRLVFLDRDELHRLINTNVTPTVEESVVATLRRVAL